MKIDQDAVAETDRLARQKRRGMICLILGSALSFGAMSTREPGDGLPEIIGAWLLPIGLWVVGFYFLLKGGGRAS